MMHMCMWYAFIPIKFAVGILTDCVVFLYHMPFYSFRMYLHQRDIDEMKPQTDYQRWKSEYPSRPSRNITTES